MESLSPNASTIPEDFRDHKRHLLAAAVYLGKNDLVTQLFEGQNIKLDGDTYFGTFFECAAKGGNDEILSCLWPRSDNAYQGVVDNPLGQAASAGCSTLIHQLISPMCNYSTKVSACKNAVASAASNGYTNVVVELIKLDTNDSLTKQDLWQDVFCIAAYHGHRQLLLKAVDAGAQIDRPVRGPSGETPLVSAARGGHNYIVGLLLTMGVNQACRPYKALCAAVARGFAGIFMLLLDHFKATRGLKNYGDVLNGDVSPNEWPPLLRVAAQHGQDHMVRLMIDLGLDVKRFPEVGHVALRKAAENGYLSIVRMLVEMGVEIDGAGGELAPVVLAAENGRDDMVAFLVQLGATSMVGKQEGTNKIIVDGVSRDNSRITVWEGEVKKVDYKRW